MQERHVVFSTNCHIREDLSLYSESANTVRQVEFTVLISHSEGERKLLSPHLKVWHAKTFLQTKSLNLNPTIAN